MVWVILKELISTIIIFTYTLALKVGDDRWWLGGGGGGVIIGGNISFIYFKFQAI